MGQWQRWLRNKLLPTINAEFVLVLFMVLIFHAHYFGDAHVMVRKLFPMQPRVFWLLLWAYGLLTLALNMFSFQDSEAEAKAKRYEELRKKFRDPSPTADESEEELDVDPMAWLLLLGSALGHSLLMGSLAITMKRPTPWDLVMLFYAITQCGLALYYILFPTDDIAADLWQSSWYKCILLFAMVVGATLLLERWSPLSPMAITTSIIAGFHVAFEVRRRWLSPKKDGLAPKDRSGLV